MKVLMAAVWPVGGIRTFLQYLYSQAAFETCNISLVTPGDDLAKFFSSSIPPARFEVRTCSGGLKGLAVELRKALRSGEFDLLHTHGLTTAVIGQFVRVGCGIPHLTTAHDVFLPTMFAGPFGRARQAALNVALWSIDGVHAVSDDCAKNFREYVPMVPAQRVRSILNGIDTNRFCNAEGVDAHARLGLSRETRLVGFFGRFMAQKGFVTLVDAVCLLAQTTGVPPFRIVTFGWGGFIREDFDYVKERGVAEYFVQMPHTDQPERWMKAMDIVAMPSRWEACGLVAMEALSAGIPIIGSNCIGLREVLFGSPARTICAGSADELAKALENELRNPRREAFHQYQRSAVERFKIETAAERIRELYDELIAG